MVEKKNGQVERWYAEGATDSLATVFATDAWQMPPNAAPLVGREAIRGFWAQAFHWGDWVFDLETLDIVVSDSIAVERGAYALSFEAGPEAPMPPFDDRGHYVVLWRLEDDGEWRVVWDAPVSALPVGGDAANENEQANR